MAKALHQEGFRMQFVFVGGLANDPYQREFRSQIKKAEAAGYASYAGQKNTGELIALLDQADAMIHFPNEEAFGLVVAEALARNMKFFGAALGGIHDIAQGQELADLFPGEDWGSLKKGITQWLQKGAPKPTHAAEECAARYHPRVIALRHVEIYREVLNASS